MMDARIGQLNSGKCYAFIHGYHAEPYIGTRAEVEVQLGLRDHSESSSLPVQEKHQSKPKDKVFNVCLRYEYPAWDQTEGLMYWGIEADSKSEANRIVRKRAWNDGHLAGGQGRVIFTATEDTP